MKKSRISLCRECQKKLEENNYVTEVGKFSNGEFCQLCGRFYPEIRLLEYENKKDSDLRRSIRRSRERGHQPKKDTRAYYRGPWRDEEP